MNREQIEILLSEWLKTNHSEVQKFSAYIIRQLNDTHKSGPNKGKNKNPFMQHKKAEEMAELFIRVAEQGLWFDGVSITLQSTGVTYDYNAYKNKMMLTYPESLIDIQLVYEGDTYNFLKDSGKVVYTHDIADPFSSENRKDEDIIGAYCIIKNSRGEFLTTMDKIDVEKRKKVAKTESIWNAWNPEMILKTVAKRGFSFHFKDLYKGIEEMDNENYDLDQVVVDDPDAELNKIWDEIVSGLTKMKDKEEAAIIRSACRDKWNAEEFDLNFARLMLKRI